MKAARWMGVVVLLGIALPAVAGEIALAGRLKESIGELGEAYGQLAAQLERAGVAARPGLTQVLTELGGRATKASAALAERPDPDTMRQAREAWEIVGFARRLVRRIRHEHADAADLPGAPQHAELWGKMMDVAAKAIRSQMEQREIDTIRLEAELDVMSLAIEQEREKRERREEFREFFELAAEHKGDPGVAAVLADLKARLAALAKAQEVRFQAERAEIQVEAQERVLDAMKDEHRRLGHAAERELDELGHEIERLIDRAERRIDQIEEAKEEKEEREEQEDDRRPGKADGKAEM